MIRIGILGDIGSGKSYIAKQFGYPVFNADEEVSKLYKKDRKTYNKLKKSLPKYISSFPVNKLEISNSILSNKINLKKIVNIVHKEVRKKMKLFLNKNKNKKIVILDIPLLLENKLNSEKDILIFVQSNKSEIFKRLKTRDNFNLELIKRFRDIQLSLDYKKKKSMFIIKNNFTKKRVLSDIKIILNKILK